MNHRKLQKKPKKNQSTIPITDSQTLRDFCDKISKAPYISIDTEFLRDKTYWPLLCLVQIAYGPHQAVIDTLAKDLDLDPLRDILEDQKILKVFHSASQDMEVLYTELGVLTTPIFDTQIAAMVRGFGDQVGYAKLVNEVLGESIDKAGQLTDWSKRPLRPKQISYALSDVTHLCHIYEKLSRELEEEGRTPWVQEEMQALTNEALYQVDLATVWKRVKYPNQKPRGLLLMQIIAAWREDLAQQRNTPRGWVMKDTTMVDMANQCPRNVKDLLRIRGMDASLAKGSEGKRLLSLITKALETPKSCWPALPPKKFHAKTDSSLIALLRALLELCCKEKKVAPKLIANREELESLASSKKPSARAMKGWRWEVFGKAAIALVQGKLALTAHKGSIKILWLDRS